MKKSEFPNEMEWDKIVDEAFSSDDEHIFSEHYNLRKQQMLRRNNMTHKKFNKKRGIGLVVAAAAVTVAIPTSIFAYEKLTAKIEKTANYENTVTIQTPVVDEGTEEQGYMYYEFGWIPEGFEADEQGLKYHREETNGGITPSFYKFPDDTTVEISLPFSADYETYETEGKTAFVNYREPMHFNDNPFTREIFVSFEDTSYVLRLHITKDISQEDMYKFIDNINLVPSDEMKYNTYIPWLEDKNTSEDNQVNQKPESNVFEENMRNIGDTISYPFEGEGTHSGYDITLNSVELTDSFDGIHTDACGWEYDYSEFMDGNGNVIENIRTGIKHGDGINTTDEIISEQSLPIHILKMNLTYTNTNDIAQDYIISPLMFIMEDGKPILLSETMNQGDISYYDTIEGMERRINMFSMEVASENSCNKNYIHLEKGESTDVQLAFFVDDNVKDKVYLDFRVSGGGHSPVDFGEYYFVGQ